MRRQTTVLATLLLFASSCAIAPDRAYVEGSFDAPRADLSVAAVTLISGNYGGESLAACVERRLHRLRPSIRYFPGEEFLDRLFPWFEPDTAPISTYKLAAVLDRPLVRERIADLGIRYVIRLSGELHGKNLGAGGFVAGWYQSARLEASVLDLHGGQALGTVSAYADGVEYTIPIPPYVFSPHVHDTVCNDIVDRLAPLLGGG